jgi:hypothetical protein
MQNKNPDATRSIVSIVSNWSHFHTNKWFAAGGPIFLHYRKFSGRLGVKLGVVDWKAAMEKLLSAVLLGLPFFLWGTNMVVMEEVMPKTGAMFMAATRLIPAGALVLAFARSVAIWIVHFVLSSPNHGSKLKSSKASFFNVIYTSTGFVNHVSCSLSGKKLPSGKQAWLSIAVFGLINGALFQSCLVEGLMRTTAGLGSVSFPLSFLSFVKFLAVDPVFETSST